MIAIDTNVLVSYLVEDDERLAAAASTLLDGLTPESPGFICREVLQEVVWVLGRGYRYSREQIADVVVELLGSDSLAFESADDVAKLTAKYSQSGADFADLMILAAAERSAARPLYTFDRRFARMRGVTLVETW